MGVDWTYSSWTTSSDERRSFNFLDKHLKFFFITVVIVIPILCVRWCSVVKQNVPISCFLFLVFLSFDFLVFLCVFGGSWKWPTWWKKEMWGLVAYFQNSPSEESIYFWPISQEEGNLQGIVWVLHGSGICRS